MFFACICVPDFPAAAIVRNEPELRGQAVAVVDGTPPLLSVVAANERARQAGVEVGMTKLQAVARLSAGRDGAKSTEAGIAVVRHRSLAQEAAAHAALADCARGFSPRVEELTDAPDMVLADVAGLDRLFGSSRTIAIEVARRASALGLETNIAVTANLDAAICAARGFPGVTVIPEGKETERLASLPIDVLLQGSAVENGRARAMQETFDRWGIRTFRAFAALPDVAVSERLGQDGARLQKLARGKGTRTLAPSDAPFHFEEAIELEYPIEDMEALTFVLNRLIEQLCERLNARALSTNELRLRMKLDSCGEYVGAQHGSARMNTKTPGTGSPEDYMHVIRLPVPMLDAKTFLRLWQLELRGKGPGAPVAKVWLSAEPVQPRFAQGGLFLPTAPEPERLEVTLARIASIVRHRSQVQDAQQGVRVGSAEVLDSHTPDAFRVERFAPPHAEERRGAQAKRPRITEANHSWQRATALRRVRPPVRITVELQEGRPLRLQAATLNDIMPGDGEISWCAGPWRSSGEWWNESWSREEWDVAVKGERGQWLCRIYLSAGDWFLEGTYD